MGPIADRLPAICSEASISRFLRARNWNTKKAGKMLKETIKWRLEFKPEKIRWVSNVHASFKDLNRLFLKALMHKLFLKKKNPN